MVKYLGDEQDSSFVKKLKDSQKNGSSDKICHKVFREHTINFANYAAAKFSNVSFDLSGHSAVQYN